MRKLIGQDRPDVYGIVSVGSKEWNTNVVKNSQAATWNEWYALLGCLSLMVVYLSAVKPTLNFELELLALESKSYFEYWYVVEIFSKGSKHLYCINMVQ